MINEVIRSDSGGELMSNACVLVRAINQLVVMRRQGSSVFPENGVTFRGGALPLQQPGRRVPCVEVRLPLRMLSNSARSPSPPISPAMPLSVPTRDYLGAKVVGEGGGVQGPVRQRPSWLAPPPCISRAGRASPQIVSSAPLRGTASPV